MKGKRNPGVKDPRWHGKRKRNFGDFGSSKRPKISDDSGNSYGINKHKNDKKQTSQLNHTLEAEIEEKVDQKMKGKNPIFGYYFDESSGRYFKIPSPSSREYELYVNTKGQYRKQLLQELELEKQVFGQNSGLYSPCRIVNELPKNLYHSVWSSRLYSSVSPQMLSANLQNLHWNKYDFTHYPCRFERQGTLVLGKKNGECVSISHDGSRLTSHTESWIIPEHERLLLPPLTYQHYANLGLTAITGLIPMENTDSPPAVLDIYSFHLSPGYDMSDFEAGFSVSRFPDLFRIQCPQLLECQTLMSDNEKLFAGTSHGNSILLDIPTLHLPQVLRIRGVKSCCASNENHSLVWCGLRNGQVTSYDCRSGNYANSFASLQDRTTMSHQMPVSSVAVLKDDVSIISASDEGTVCLWDTRTGKLLQSRNFSLEKQNQRQKQDQSQLRLSKPRISANLQQDTVAVGCSDGIFIWNLAPTIAAPHELKIGREMESEYAMMWTTSNKNEEVFELAWLNGVDKFAFPYSSASF